MKGGDERMPGWVWDAVLIMFGIAEVWVFFVEPSIGKRESASAQKRREHIEERKAQLDLDRQELQMLEELEARRKELKKE
jgi:hypothetical protein